MQCNVHNANGHAQFTCEARTVASRKSSTLMCSKITVGGLGSGAGAALWARKR